MTSLGGNVHTHNGSLSPAYSVQVIALCVTFSSSDIGGYIETTDVHWSGPGAGISQVHTYMYYTP